VRATTRARTHCCRAALQVSYGQAQQQTPGLYPLQANGTVVLDDLTLWFADARPLQRDCTLSIHAYLKRPSPAKDRLLGCFSVPCAQLVQQCDGATCQLPRCYVPVAAAAPFFNTTFAAAVAAGDGAAAAPAAGAEAGAAQGGACPIAAAFVAAALASATAAEAAATSCRAHGGADISSGGSMPQALQQALCCVDSGCKGDSRLAAVARRIGQGAAAAALVLHMGMSDVDLRAQHCGVPLYAAPAAELGQDHAQTQPRVLGVANSSSSSSSSSSDSSACAEDDGLVQDQAALSSMPGAYACWGLCRHGCVLRGSRLYVACGIVAACGVWYCGTRGHAPMTPPCELTTSALACDRGRRGCAPAAQQQHEELAQQAQARAEPRQPSAGACSSTTRACALQQQAPQQGLCSH
jgi:hypothetical protein